MPVAQVEKQAIFHQRILPDKAKVAHTVWQYQFTNFKAGRNHYSFYVVNFLQRFFSVRKFSFSFVT